MSFIKELKSYFFRGTAPINPNVSGDLKDNLADRGAPTQDTFERLVASTPFFKESADRAKLSTAGAIENEVGIVAVTTDAKAKAGTSGLEADRTLVVHASQLPTPDAQSDTIDDFTGESIEVTVDAGVTTRNNYLFNLSTAFKNWLLTRLLPGGGTIGQVLSKVSGTDYDVEWSTAAASGEVNTTISLGGTVELTAGKVGDVLQFRGLDNNDGYLDLTQNALDVSIDLDEVSLLNYIQNNVIFPAPPAVPIDSISNIGGFNESFKQITGTDAEFRTLEANTGIIITQTANTLQFSVDPTYINSVVSAGGSSGLPYLFHATSNSEQLALDVGSKIKFLNDSTDGNFDNGNTWSTSQWEANASVVGESLEFSAELLTEQTGTFAGSVEFTLTKEDAGGIKTPLDVVTVVVGVVAGTQYVDLFTNVSTGVIVAGDKIYIEVTANTLAPTDLKVRAGSIIYNVTA